MSGKTLELTEELDLEWVKLIQEARSLGLSTEEVREFLQSSYAIELEA